jgi:hypothetical protein
VGRLAARRTDRGEVAGDERADRVDHGQQEHDQREHDRDGEHPVATAQHQPAEEQADHPVVGEDVAGEKQRGVDEPEHDQPEAAAAQDSDGRPLRGAGGHLPPEDLDHPVPEEEREQRVDPQVQHGDHQELHDPVGGRAVDGMPPGRAVVRGPQVEDRVGHDDQQQHDAACEVGRDGALLRPGRSARERRIARRGEPIRRGRTATRGRHAITVGAGADRPIVPGKESRPYPATYPRRTRVTLSGAERMGEQRAPGVGPRLGEDRRRRLSRRLGAVRATPGSCRGGR